MVLHLKLGIKNNLIKQTNLFRKVKIEKWKGIKVTLFGSLDFGNPVVLITSLGVNTELTFLRGD